MTASEPSVLASTREILLVEQSSMIGSIIVSTARQLQLCPVRLVTNCNSAQLLLKNQVFCGLITSLDEAGAALNMIDLLRQGQLRCDANMPVAVTAAHCDVAMANRIKGLNVQRILLKPFKIRDLITTIQSLVATPPNDALR
jgi:DNA-binding NtrC family response regulator